MGKINNLDDKQHLTSARVDKEVFEEFRVQTIRTKFSLQKLVDRAMFLYITDEEFRKLMHSTSITPKTKE